MCACACASMCACACARTHRRALKRGTLITKCYEDILGHLEGIRGDGGVLQVLELTQLEHNYHKKRRSLADG